MNKQAKTVLTLILTAMTLQFAAPAHADHRNVIPTKDYTEWPIDPSVVLARDERGHVEYVSNKRCSRDRFEFQNIETGQYRMPVERSMIVSLESRVKDYNHDPRWTAIATRFFIEPDRVGSARPVRSSEGVTTYEIEYDVCYQVREGVVLK